LSIGEAAFRVTRANAPAQGVRECRVVGVVATARTALRKSEGPAIYLPLGSVTDGSRVLLRPRSEAAPMLAGITQAAYQTGLGLHFLDRLSARAEELLAPFVLIAWISGALGSLALAMAAVGLYGVMAFSVNQRIREIGIRVALGATAANVIRLFVGQGMRLVAIGAVVGLAGGGLLALALRKLTFGLGGAFDGIAFGAVTAVLGIVALLACWLPARRATRVDPVVALRAE
jgi:predicted lysophospholipase L1 biosynthesis ABC-type transport system permease subunit